MNVARMTLFLTQGNGGWSESWYKNTDSLSDAASANISIQAARLPLMSVGASIVARRETMLEGDKLSQLTLTSEAGSSGLAKDINKMALRVRVYTGVGNGRTVLLRGLPDARVVEGVYASSSAFNTAVLAYFNTVKQAGGAVLERDRSKINLLAVRIDGDGLVTAQYSTGPLTGAMVKFVRSRDSLGKSLRGTYNVFNTTNASLQFNLVNWRAGRTAQSAYFYFSRRVANVIISAGTQYSVTTRQVGRPFGQPRGRVRVAR